MTDLTSWLASLDDARLERVLSRRPDTTAGLVPRNLDQLAQRLSHPHNLAAFLDTAPAPLHQVSEALLVLTVPRTEAALRDLLQRHEPDHDAAVATTLERLYDCAIAWPSADGSIGLAAGLAQVFPRALGLGPPLDLALEGMTGTSLMRALKLLGQPRPPTRRNDAADALRQRLTDPEAVRAIVAAAPASIARQLHAIAHRGIAGTTALDIGADNHGLDFGAVDRDYLRDDPDLGGDGLGRYEPDVPPYARNDSARNDYARNDYARNDYAPEKYGVGAMDLDFRDVDYGRYSQRYEAESWAVERGLMAGNTFGGQSFMPAEIGLALRAKAEYAPFSPYPPSIPSIALDPAAVDSAATAAATDFAGQAVAILDLIARAPLTRLKSGGVGARELARVAKTVGTDEAAVRLAIEVAAELGLLAWQGGFLQATSDYSSWRELEPSAAYARLLDAWLAMPFHPTGSADVDGRATRLLQRSGNPGQAVDARDVLLTVLAALPPGRGTTRADLAPALLWSRPRVAQIPQDARTPYATVWSEADRLGVIAAGALSRIGRAVDDRDGNELATVLREMLPASTDAARFGSDLTVLVSGSPSARVSSLLDHAADRESRGAGVTWRFSPASVRRALDDGADGAGLLTALEAIAVGDLPQPLRYLVNDVARRHGELQVSAAMTIIRGDDAALLAQVAADRGLRGLGLRLVAPTVVTSAKPASDTLLALRAAGYLPVPEPGDPAGPPAPIPASRIPRPPSRSPTERPQLRPTDGSSGRSLAGGVVSLRAMATQLLSTHVVDDSDGARRSDAPVGADAAATATEQVLGRLNPRLSADEIYQLAYAVETGGPVSITYESTSGARTRRVIGRAKLGAGMLDAWCYLRNDERYFLVDRILAVAPGSP